MEFIYSTLTLALNPTSMGIRTMMPTSKNNDTYLGIVADGSDKITLKVLDVYGRMAKTIQAQIEDGMNELLVNISDLKVGVYVVNAFSGGRFLKAVKFVKDA